MRLYAPFGTSHRFGSFCYVHVLPVTHEERFSLTRRQFLHFFFNYLQDLCPFYLIRTRLGRLGTLFSLVGFQYIKVFVLFLPWAKTGEEANPGVTDFFSAEIIKYRRLQDALEQRGQFGRRLVTVFFGQFDHCILNNVQG